MAWFSKDKELSDILAPLTTVKANLEAFIAKAHVKAEDKTEEAKKLNAEAVALLEDAAGAEKVAGNLATLLGA